MKLDFTELIFSNSSGTTSNTIIALTIWWGFKALVYINCRHELAAHLLGNGWKVMHYCFVCNHLHSVSRSVPHRGKECGSGLLLHDCTDWWCPCPLCQHAGMYITHSLSLSRHHFSPTLLRTEHIHSLSILTSILS